MLRTSSCVIALNAIVAAALAMTVQAADSILTLACQGTVTVYEHPRTTTAGDAKPEPFSMGITINRDGSGLRYGVSGQNNQH